MEKSTPHCKLAVVQALLKEGKVRATGTALAGAASLELTFEEMVTIVAELRASDFQKSMTTYADHTIWQDVYRPHTAIGDVYLKLTVVDEVLIVSFKEQ